MKDKLQELIGHVEDGSDVSLTIFQDDVAPYHYHIYAKQCGEEIWSHSGLTLESAINNAYFREVKQ